MLLDEESKLEVLLAAFRDRRAEVTYWRRHAWHVVVFFVAVCALIAAAGHIGHVTNPGKPTFFLAIAATAYIVQLAKSADAAARRLAEIEDALGFFEEGRFVEELALQPIGTKDILVGDVPMGIYIAAIWCGAILAIF